MVLITGQTALEKKFDNFESRVDINTTKIENMIVIFGGEVCLSPKFVVIIMFLYMH